MKQCAIVLIVVGLAALNDALLNDEQRKMMADMQSQCATEVSTPPAMVEAMGKGEFPDNADMETFAFCMAKKTGFMDDAGEIQDEDMRLVISMIIDEDETNKLVDKCAKKLDSPGKTAKSMLQCIYDSGFH